MSEDRWVRIVDPEHVLRAATDEVWHSVHYQHHWCSVVGLDRHKYGDVSLYRARCRLRDVPPGTKIVDPGPDHELVEPWERDPAGITEYWGISTQSWRLRPYPRNTLTDDDIYRRPIAKPVSKTPQPGEWWLENDGSGRAYMHAFDQFGKVIYEFHTGAVYSKVLGWATWHHEPACTGWDWQPPQTETEPLTLTLEQRVEALEQQVQKLERQVNEWEDSQ